MLLQLEENPCLWNQRPERRDAPNSPHKAMSDIWLRYNTPEEIPSGHFHDMHYPVWYPAWPVLTSLHSIVWELMTLTRGEHLGGILITRIPPKGRIEPHVDRSWHVDFFNCKCYLSLKSQPGADFFIGDEVLNPKAGEVWRIDNRERHWVINDSADERMTLIVCIRSGLFGE